MRSKGASFGEIAQDLDISKSTVKRTVDLAPTRQQGTTTLRPGRPLITDDRDKRAILRYIKQKPKATYAQVRSETGTNVSDSTLKRILAKCNIRKWLAKKRPLLLKIHAKKRRQWCQVRKDWLTDEWAQYIFSDECSVERGAGKQREWVFRMPGQQWDTDKVSLNKTGKDISIMIWGAIWLGGRLDLVVMRRDENSERGGYSAVSYLELLQDEIPRIWQPGMTYMQDNASIHTARIIKRWLIDNGITTTDWPPYSPDLNPIETLWAILKQRLNKDYTHLLSMGKQEEAVNAFARAINDVWHDIPQATIDALIKGMDGRVNEVLHAKGWYTRH